MKKKIFSLIAFTFIAMGLFTACTSPSTIKGEFKEESYLVSLVDERRDFSNELVVSGASLSDIVFSSSNENILLSEGAGVFKIVESGEAYIFAKTQNKTIAKTKVSVKYRFSSPKNITISESGILSWDKSYVRINDQTYYASSYEVGYAKYDANADAFGEMVYEYPNENSLALTAGSYRVLIHAVKDDDNLIDASEKEEKDVSYGVVGTILNARVEKENEFNVQTARFAWDAPVGEDVVYDVYLEGFKIKSNISETYIDFDFSRYGGGKEIELIIKAKDRQGKKLPSSASFNLNKLSTPALSYYYSGKEGLLAWNGDSNARSYIVSVYSFENDEYTFIEQANAENIVHILKGFEGGAYNVQVMAVAKEGFYLNSNPSEERTVAKLSKPNIDIDIIGNQALVTFESGVYSKNYKISYGGREVYYNTDAGMVATLDLSGLEAGAYCIDVVALPNEDDKSGTGAESIAFEGFETDKILNSDTSKFEFWIFEEVAEPKHELRGNLSIITFDQIKFDDVVANDYKFYINDQLVEYPIFEIDQEGKVAWQIANLNQIDPNENAYNFKIDAGLKADDKDLAIRVVKEKTLTILSKVEKSGIQPNGFFNWETVAGDVEYFYEVYLADSSYNIKNPTPVASATTTKTSTIALDFGEYYKVKVYSKSTNENDYLDSTFADETAFLEEGFIVTEKIATPMFEFSVEDDDFVLTIEGVEFGGNYKVYIDGALDGEIVVSAGDQKSEYKYTIINQFEEAKVYEVEVVASSGLAFDANLFVDSATSKIFIERLAGVTFDMQFTEDIYGRISKTEMAFDAVDHASGVAVYREGEIVSTNGFELDLSNSAVFGNEFVLTAKYIASLADDNFYYLDSLPVEFSFKRAEAPSAVHFENGMIKWTAGNLETFDRYEAVLSFINTDSQNYYYSFEIEKELNALNVQNMISNLVESDSAFASAYRQAQKILFEIYAFANGADENGVYLISSVKGVAIGGGAVYEIKQLAKPVVEIDVDNEKLSWTEEDENSIYDVYVDDILILEGFETNEVLLSELGEFDFLSAKRIKVQATNKGYLSSAMSDEIVVEKIQISNRISVSGTTATFEIPYDQSKVGSVFVNGQKTNVNYSLGDPSATFDLLDFVGVSNFEIVLYGKTISTNYYYLQSSPVSFELINLADLDLEEEVVQKQVADNENLKEDFITWKDIGADLQEQTSQTIVYTVKIKNGASTYDFAIQDCEFNLEEIESRIGRALNGDVTITVEAKTNAYTLTNDGSGALGYYGVAVSGEILTAKLAKAEIKQVSVVADTTRPYLLEQKMFSGLNVAIEDKWVGQSNLYFTVVWNYVVGEETFERIYYFDNLTSTDGMYNLNIEIGRDGYVDAVGENFFLANSTDVSVFVFKDGAINSDETEFVVNRLSSPTSSSIDEDGKITITPQENVSYLLELRIADAVVYTTISSQQLEEGPVDILTSLFGQAGKNGEYEIKILAIDPDNKVLPSATFDEIKGYQIAGIDDVYSDEGGNIVFQMLPGDYDNLIFSARITGTDERRDFDCFAVEGEENKLSVSATEILNLFEDKINSAGEFSFDFTVRKAGSINANWVSHTINYQTGDFFRVARATEIDKDYIIFEKENGSIQTVAFNVIVSGLFNTEKGVDEEGNPITEIGQSEETHSFTAEAVLGYWVSDASGKGFFAETMGNEAGLVYTECYAVSINEALKNVVYGNVDIKVARVGKGTDGKIYQYNDGELRRYKLNEVLNNVAKIENSILKWNWISQDQENPTIAPSAYYVKIESGVLTKILVTSKSLDLTRYILQENVEYKISVWAVNFNSNIIASNETTTLTTQKHSVPNPIEVEGGRIVFDRNAFKESDFIKKINEYFKNPELAEQQLYELIGVNGITSPINSSAGDLASDLIRVQIRFVAVSGGLTNKEYIYTVSALDLFPDILIDTPSGQESYLKLLERYKSSYLGGSTLSQGQIYLKGIINSLSLANRGIGDDGVILADIAKDLPFGDYKVSIAQVGTNNEIRSEFGEAIDVHISSAPDMMVDQEVDSASGKNVNIVWFAPAMNMIGDGTNKESYSSQASLVYKMRLKYENEKGEQDFEELFVDFIIRYDEDVEEWTLSYQERDMADYNIISTEAKPWVGAIPKFKINLNNLKKLLKDIEVLRENALIKFDVFTYSCDNLYVLNGKSARLDLRYLDLTSDKISFSSGQLCVEGDGGNVFDLMLRYKYSTQGELSTTKKFQDGKAEIKLTENGVYDYILLSLKGSYSQLSVNVESDCYKIENLYKLTAPVLTTKENQLVVTYAPADLVAGEVSTIQFMLANNGRCSKLYERETEGFDGVGVKVSYDDCNPFGVIAGDFLDTGSISHTNEDASEDVKSLINTFGQNFIEFIDYFDIPSSGNLYSPEISDEALDVYAQLYGKAFEIYDKSLVSFTQGMQGDISNSAIIGLNKSYVMTLGDINSDEINLREAVAHLFGFEEEEFATFAQQLAEVYKKHREEINASDVENEYLNNGCFYTDEQLFIFPIAIKNDISNKLLMYLILDTEDRLSVWVDNVETMLLATNFNEDYHTSSVINNEMYCKNILFITKPEFYNKSSLSSKTSESYVIGSADKYGNVITSELSASTFYAYLCGNSGTFRMGDVEEDGTVILNFVAEDLGLSGSSSKLIMSSDMGEIDARMLKRINRIDVSNGDFLLDDSIVGANPVTNNVDECNIFYEIVVKYYIEGDDTARYSETYYSERLQSSDTESFAQPISSSIIDQTITCDYYKLFVTTLAGIKVDEGASGVKETIEGTYFRMNESLFYAKDPQVHVLRSETVESAKITRVKTPYIEEGTKGVYNGVINFVIDKSLYYCEDMLGAEATKEQKDQDTRNRIKVYAQYFENGTLISKEVTGVMTFETSSEMGQENKVFVYLKPDEGLFGNYASRIDLYVTISGRDIENDYSADIAHGVQAITSKPLIIDGIYKLPKPDERYYSIEYIMVGGVWGTYLNLEKYFQDVSYDYYDNTTYKIYVEMTLEDGLTEVLEIRNSDESKKINLRSVREILIQVQDAQSVLATNSKKLLHSDSLSISVAQTQTKVEDVQQLEVTWNNELMRFEWNWLDARDGEYEYFVDINISGNQIREVVESNFYMPRIQGQIINFSIRAREKDAEALYSYSDEVIYDDGLIRNELFSGGDGKANNPYIITNEEQFLNISKRNTETEKFFFKLGANIELNVANFYDSEGQNIIADFYGELDGNGFTITVKSSVAKDMESISCNLVGFTAGALNFSQYSSLFKNISKDAVVKNLKIEYELSYNSLNSSNIVFSPIALYNYGAVTGVTVVESTAAFNGRGENNVFVGGIVGFNYGLIEDCINRAEIDCMMTPNLSINFGYGGLCLYNMSKTGAVGTIRNCYNQSGKNIIATTDNSKVYLAGISLVNIGVISVAGNDGDMTLVGDGATTFRGYFAGITITSIGTLEYVYNNGKMSNTHGSLMFGGIAYDLSGGVINTLVDTAGMPIASKSDSKPTDIGENFAVAGSSSHMNITSSQIKSIRIDCGEEFELVISEVSVGKFIARVE